MSGTGGPNVRRRRCRRNRTGWPSPYWADPGQRSSRSRSPAWPPRRGVSTEVLLADGIGADAAGEQMEVGPVAPKDATAIGRARGGGEYIALRGGLAQGGQVRVYAKELDATGAGASSAISRTAA